MVIKMNKKLLKLILILSFLTIKILYKKNDYTEINECAYVSSMGLDFNNETNTYTVYMYILNNFNLSSSDFGQSFPNSIGYISIGTGTTIPEAIENINNKLSIRLLYSHIRTLILKNTFVNKNNLLTLYNIIKKLPDFFPTFQIYSTNDDLFKLYNIKNFSETSAYYTVLINNETKNKPLKVVYTNLINNLLIDTYTTPIPLLKLHTNSFYEDESELPSLSIIGYSYLTNDYKLSSFTFNNLHALYSLNNLSNNILIFNNFDYLVQDYYIKKKYKNNKLQILITIKGTFINNTLNQTNQELKDNLTQQMKENLIILKQTMDNYNIDAFNIDYLSNKKYSYLSTPLDINIKVI